MDQEIIDEQEPNINPEFKQRSGEMEILQRLVRIEQVMKGYGKAQDRLFGAFEKVEKRWEELDKALALCKQNGDNETKCVAKEIGEIKDSHKKIENAVIENYQAVQEQIADLKKEPDKKKTEDIQALELRNLQFSYRKMVVTTIVWVLLGLAGTSAAGSLWLHKNGMIDLNEKGKIIPTASTNRTEK